MTAETADTENLTAQYAALKTKFIGLMPPCAEVLVFGCGEGEDAKMFSDAGFKVDAAEADEEKARRAEERLGAPVDRTPVLKWKPKKNYDGIWIGSALVHLANASLEMVLRELSEALREGGQLYIAFRHGDSDRIENGKLYQALSEAGLPEFDASFPTLKAVDSSVTEDFRENEKGAWFNVFFRKTNIRTAAVLALLDYASELSKIRNRVITNVSGYRWHKYLDELPDDLPGLRKWKPSDGESDVLLSLQQQDLPVCPPPPSDVLGDWLPDDWSDPNWEEFYFDTPRGWQGSAEDAPHFEDDPVRPAAWNAWLAKRDAWLSSYKKTAASLKLFEALYMKAREVAESGGELVAMAGSVFFASDSGHGSAAVPVISQPVDVTVRVKPTLSGARSVIEVRLSESEPPAFQSRIFSEFPLEGFNQEACQILADQVNDRGPHPFCIESVRSGCEKLAGLLCPPKSRWANSYSECHFSGAAPFWFYERPVIWVQVKPSDLGDAADEISRLIERGAEVPQHLTDLACGAEALEASDASEEPKKETLAERLASVGGESSRILLSKPANREQLQIAEDIEKHSGVLVQGPPGTGKTHTIANLIGHFLAQGKRILVTSEKAKALTVLKEKLPPEIQSLCVTYVEGNGDAEKTVSSLTESLGELREASLRARVESERAERASVIEGLAGVRTKLYAMLGEESEKVSADGREFTYEELGAWLHENAALADRIPFGDVPGDVPCPLSEEEMKRLYASNAGFTADDERQLRAGLPDPALLPDAEKVKAAFERIADFEKDPLPEGLSSEKQGNALLLRGKEVSALIGRESAKSVSEVRNRVAQLAADRDVPAWLWSARTAAGASSGPSLTLWNQLASLIRETSSLATKYAEGIVRFPVTLKAGADRTPVREAVSWFREHGETGEPGFWLKLTQGARIEKLNQVAVSGHAPRTIEEYDAALAYLDLLDRREMLARAWAALIEPLGGPAFSEFKGDFPSLEISRRYMAQIDGALLWWDGVLKPVVSAFETCGVKFGSAASDPERFAKRVTELCASDLRGIAEYAGRAAGKLAAEEELRAMAETLRRSSGSEMIASAADALSALDAELYAKAASRLLALQSVSENAKERDALLKKLSGASPRWAEALREHREGFGGSVPPEDWAEAWRWHRYSAVFARYAAEDANALFAEAVKKSAELRRITTSLASDLAWLRLKEHLNETPGVVQSLKAWSQVVKRIGKGTGKLARTNLRKAQELMESCETAVPVWIMPIERALRAFRGKEPFDILIIDEASQSDVTTVPVLFLAKKAIITGDDRQVSPTAVGVDALTAENIAVRCLKGRVANYQTYQPTTSLYDIAATAYQPLLLREHFRCVPDIINYCNRLSYDGKILPLRSGAKTELRPALIPVRVPGVRVRDANQTEADVTAALIRSCIAQPEYRGKTIGVISMLSGKSSSGNQVGVLQSAIYKAVGPQKITEHRILCGLSAEFQGDERDVIFLNLVDSPAAPGVAVHTQTAGASDMMKKRWNVAVSRAKDQLFVIYSFDPRRELSPVDLRRVLFAHIDNPEAEAKALSSGRDTPLVKAASEALAARGFSVQSRYAVGSFVLDLVVTDGEKRAAVECDEFGARDTASSMERQTILERCGWKFTRLRAGEYARDPDAAVSRIAEDLAGFGVKPENAVDKASENTLKDRVLQAAGVVPAANGVCDVSGLKMAELPEDAPEKAPEAKSETVPEKEEGSGTENGTHPVSGPKSEAETPAAEPRAENADAESGRNAGHVSVADEFGGIAKKTPEEFFRGRGLYVSDKRPRGYLWVAGGREIAQTVREAEQIYGLKFEFINRKVPAAGGSEAWRTK